MTYGAGGVGPAGGGAALRRRDDLGRRGVVLLAVGSALTLLFALSLWSWRTFANSEGFADVATDTLKEPAVAEAVADQIVNVLQDQVATAQYAVVARPILRQVVAEVVATEAFKGLFHAGVRELHGAVVQGTRTRLLVPVDDAAELVKEALAVVNPGMAESLSDDTLNLFVGVSQSPSADLFMRAADLAGWLILPLAAGAAACFVAAVRRAIDRRRVLEVVGACLIGVGGVIFVVLAALLNVAADVGQDPRQRTALRAVFWSAMHLLNVTAKVLIVLGAVLTLAAALAGRGPLHARLTEMGESVRATLAHPRARAVAAVGAIVIGLVGLIWPLAVAEVLVRILAVALVVLGVVWVFDLIGASSWVARHEGTGRHRVTPRRLALGGTTGVATFSVVLLLGGMSFVRAVRAPNLDRLGIDEAGCNGHAALCDRRIDEVSFAGAHNAMSASGDDFLFARHTGGPGAQLGNGIRAFLLDLHYGGPIKDLVRTDFLSEAEQALSDSQLTTQERLAVDRVFGLAGADVPDEDRQVYLCHAYCELGASPAKKVFRLFHDWLRVNPNEVVILVLEDHVTAEDAVDVLESSGLSDRAFTWVPGAPAPTLRELIERKRNVLILAENYGGAVRPWYHRAYEGLLQDTEYDFESLEALGDPESCRPLRGQEDAPLLLMNHWLDSGVPSPNLAGEANAMEFLQDRAQTCRERLGRAPNIVAVDFYARGDVLRVVDRLNGVDIRDAVLATAGP